MAVSAVSKSRRYPGTFKMMNYAVNFTPLSGKTYESHLSSYHQVYVSPSCELQPQMITFKQGGLNSVIIAIILAIVATILLIFFVTICFR